MTNKKEIQLVLSLSNPSYTELRRYSKETLIWSLIEMKKSYTSEAVRLKELDLEMLKMSQDLETKKVNAELAKSLLEYPHFLENNYGPHAIAGISGAISTLMGTGELVVPSVVKDVSTIEARIEAAREKGFRWNSSDKRPELFDTVVRKIEQWEKSLEAGRAANPANFVNVSYEDVIKNNGECEAFVVGLCEVMEEKCGLGAPSKYLKTRYRKNMSKIFGEVVPTKEAISYDDQASGLAERFWGDNISPDQMAVIKKKLTGRIEKAEGVQNLTVRGLKGLCDVDHLPVAIDFPESQRQYERNRALCWSEVHDDEVRGIIDDYAKELGLE